MFLYKPESLEENLSNVRYLKSIFWKDINAFGCSYRRTWQIYNNPIYYNQAVCNLLLKLCLCRII